MSWLIACAIAPHFPETTESIVRSYEYYKSRSVTRPEIIGIVASITEGDPRVESENPPTTLLLRESEVPAGSNEILFRCFNGDDECLLSSPGCLGESLDHVLTCRRVF